MKRSIKESTIADKILFFLLLISSVSGIFIAKEAIPQSSNVTIEIDGNLLYSLPIDTDKIIKINGRYGLIIVEIKDRKVRISESHCPNLYCVKQGWITRGTIVCLPNRVVVFVGGNNTDKDIDEITG